jgi:hypothetical protein
VSALEQLLGAATAAEIVALIPNRPRRRAAPSLAGIAMAEAGVTISDLAVHVDTSRRTVGRWLTGTLPAPVTLAPALERLAGHDEAERVLALIPARAA